MKKAIKDYLAKLHDNKKDKGFSLVELIIVIAIMAILVGVVASQVLPYIEKSRKSKDQEALSNVSTEMISAITEALADGSESEANFKITVSSTAATINSGGNFAKLVMSKYSDMKNIAYSDAVDGIVAVASAEGEEASTGNSVEGKAKDVLMEVAKGLKSKACDKTFTIEYEKQADNKRVLSVNGSDSDKAVQVSGSLN